MLDISAVADAGGILRAADAALAVGIYLTRRWWS